MLVVDLGTFTVESDLQDKSNLPEVLYYKKSYFFVPIFKTNCLTFFNNIF